MTTNALQELFLTFLSITIILIIVAIMALILAILLTVIGVIFLVIELRKEQKNKKKIIIGCAMLTPAATFLGFVAVRLLLMLFHVGM